MNYDYQHIYELCKNHMHSYVLVEMNDGAKLDGIITGLDDEYVYVAVPIEPKDVSPANDCSANSYHRQFGYGGYGGYGSYGGYGPGYGYGYHARPPRRFNRLILPLAALTALSILPWY